MALTLNDILTAARDRHPSFHRTRIPHAVVARYLTGYQRRLLSKIAEVNAELVAQQASIAFAVDPANAVGVVAAGSGGGLPATDAGGLPAEVELPAGAAAEMDFAGAQVLYPQNLVNAVTPTTLQRVGAGWVVNQWTGKFVWITDGPAIDARRQILSNTADTLVISTGVDGQQWDSLPVAGQSLFEIVNPTVEISDGVGVVTAVPPEANRIGYLVRLNAQGVPYIDLTKPLVAKFAVGIDLPPHELILGGDVRVSGSTDTQDLGLYRYQERWKLGDTEYAAYLMNGQLFLIGDQRVWANVASIDLRYVPVAPALTALGDYFLLPDTAYDVLVARAAYLMATRVNGLPDVPKIDAGAIAGEAQEAEETYVLSVGRTARSFAKHVRNVW